MNGPLIILEIGVWFAGGHRDSFHYALLLYLPPKSSLSSANLRTQVQAAQVAREWYSHTSCFVGRQPPSHM